MARAGAVHGVTATSLEPRAAESLTPFSGDVVVHVEALTKRFPLRRSWREMVRHPRGGSSAEVLSGVACDVYAGEFFGLLGPNGAGKTTFLKILATLIAPDTGRVLVGGYDVVRDGARVRELVAPSLASERSLYWRLTARDNLRIACDLYGIAPADIDTRVDEALGAVDLRDTGEKMVGQFSSGMMQRLLIARALLTRPRLLILDEPTRSLDPLTAREFRRFLREELVQRRGCAVLLATHNPEEAFDLCDRVAVMNRGRMLAYGAAPELATRFLGARYDVVSPEPEHPALRALEASQAVTVITAARPEGNSSRVTLRLRDGHGAAADVLRTLVTQGMVVERFEREPLSLAGLIESVLSETADGIAGSQGPANVLPRPAQI